MIIDTQNKLLWSMKGAESLRKQSFMGFWKSQKKQDYNFELPRFWKNLGLSRDSLRAWPGTVLRNGKIKKWSYLMISDQLLIIQFLILMIYWCKRALELAKGEFFNTDAIFILDYLVYIISGWFLKARWNNLQR